MVICYSRNENQKMAYVLQGRKCMLKMEIVAGRVRTSPRGRSWRAAIDSSLQTNDFLCPVAARGSLCLLKCAGLLVSQEQPSVSTWEVVGSPWRSPAASNGYGLLIWTLLALNAFFGSLLHSLAVLPGVTSQINSLSPNPYLWLCFSGNPYRLRD